MPSIAHMKWFFCALACLCLPVAWPAVAKQADVADPQDGIQIQTRGPVHEAFAQPNELKPELGLAIQKEPPTPIPESPPDRTADGADLQWIGGYWAWDADGKDFVWVSGVLRQPPPGRQFVPGHWVRTPEGWVWVPGFWAPLNRGELPYLPEPPAPLEAEPLLPPPDDSSVFIPGYWNYRDSRFAWRPGYYAPYRSGRIWVSPRYLCTPGGFLFIDGYWDYPLEDRGLLFAPVCFSRPLWLNARWCYRPSYVVRNDCLLDSFFIRTRSFQFYFGNYYGNAYARAGYAPWFTGVGRCDPLFSYYRWNNRHNANWVVGMERAYADRVAGRVAAPPMSFAQQTTFTNQKNAQTFQQVVTPLSQFQSDKFRMVKTAPIQLDNANASTQKSRELTQLRGKLESGNKFAGTGPGSATPAPVRAPEARTLKLPIVANTKQNLVVPKSNPVNSAATSQPTSSSPPIFTDGAKALFPPSGQAPRGTKFEPPTSSAPRTILVDSPKPSASPPATRVIESPKASPPASSSPRVISSPPAASPLPKVTAPPPQAPRVIESPRNSAPPIVSGSPASSPPRVISSPPSGSGSTPRVSTPPPRMSSPPSNSRPSSPPSGRSGGNAPTGRKK